MRILAVGGGSGGHVTPVVAVFRELKAHDSKVELRFWCDRKFAPQARSIMHHLDRSLRVDTIAAGKLRRYHHLKWWQQVIHVRSIVFPNVRDMVYAGVGLVQSLYKLTVWRPDVIFTKGGFVCLPVGFAAHLLKIPLVIHDSDAHPGLTNRILARWATAIATGAPLENYTYPTKISRYVGIPIADEFVRLTPARQKAVKAALGLDATRPLVVVTGGGLGARRVNDAVVAVLDELLETMSVVLISGSGQYDELRSLTPLTNPHFQLHAFISQGMADVLGAADIVVSRAGATTLLELAAVAVPTILIPNGQLTGGHQLKNAEAYARSGAVRVLDEHVVDADPTQLAAAIHDLLADTAGRRAMADAFHAFARPDAAADVAEMVIKAANGR